MGVASTRSASDERPRPRVWIAAAEASGDALAAQLIDEIFQRWPRAVLRGLPGPLMRQRGVDGVARAEEATALGLVEVVGSVPRLARLLGRLERDIHRWTPDLVVTVDSPGLLLRLARRVRRRGFRTLHWVAPQVWAWRPGRASRVARSVDTLCCLLPFEPAWFEGGTARVVFTGHPAATRAVPHRTVDGAPVIALLPGSRQEEITRHWAVLREVARAIRHDLPDSRFTVARAPTLDADGLRGLDAEVVDGVGPAVEGADVAVVASGTASLEVAAAGVPQVVIYQVSPITWTMGRVLLREVEHLSLVNLLAGRRVVPEHHQRLDPRGIATDAKRLIGPAGADQLRDIHPVLETLEPVGSVGRVVDEAERLFTR